MKRKKQVIFMDYLKKGNYEIDSKSIPNIKVKLRLLLTRLKSNKQIFPKVESRCNGTMLVKNPEKKTSDVVEEEQWLEDLMENFGDRLTKLSFSYLKDWGKSHEVVQDVFLTCYKKRYQMIKLESVESWIYRVTVNRCKDVLRTSWIMKVIVNNELFQFRKSRDLSPEAISLRNSDNEMLAQYVLDLPVKYKEVILFFYYEDLSIEEISYVLNTNQNTIKTRLKRGRDLLGQYVGRGDFFEK